MAQNARLYDAEKQEFFQEIRELKLKCEAAGTIEEKKELKIFFAKWMFLTKLMKTTVLVTALKKMLIKTRQRVTSSLNGNPDDLWNIAPKPDVCRVQSSQAIVAQAILDDKDLGTGEEEAAVIEQVRRQFFSREMDSLNSVNGKALETLREDLSALRQENNEVAARISEVEFIKFTLE